MRQNKTLLITALTLSALVAGCEGTGPNTQNGAVAGGALGALVGGIVGHNSGIGTGGGMLIGAAAGAIAGGTLGNAADHQNGTIYHSEAEATTNVVVEAPPAPPPPPSEVMTYQPRPDAVWVSGYYAYDGYRYVWVQGHWEIPPPGYHYFHPAYWAPRGGTYVYVRGYWR